LKINKNALQQTVSPMPCYSLVSEFSVQMKLKENRKINVKMPTLAFPPGVRGKYK